jgi:death-on-curing protein
VKEPVWLDLTVVEAIHADLIREHGGALGVRDSGVLESALARPRQKWAYDRKTDLSALAAAYGFGLAKNHGFVDGNKRVSLMAIYVFLALNGRELEAPETEALDITTGVADGSVNEDQLAAWIRSRLVKYRE